MPRPKVSKMGLRDYLYYLFNVGDELENLHCSVNSAAILNETFLAKYEIGVLAATQIEAEKFVSQAISNIHLHIPHLTKHNFTAYGLDQAWRPHVLFSEVHWISSCTYYPPPYEWLATLGISVHVHLFNPNYVEHSKQERIYRWKTINDLALFWTSLYLARELSGLINLDWQTFYCWQPNAYSVAKISSGRGKNPKQAIESLVSSTNIVRSAGEILIIEGGADILAGECIEIVEELEVKLKIEAIVTSWVSPNYSGVGLKLLTFESTQL